MVFDKTKCITHEKLCSLGVKLNCRIWRLREGESWSCNKFCKRHHAHVIHLNPQDVKSRMLARQNLQHLLLHEYGHVFFCRCVRRKEKIAKLKELFGDVSKGYKRDMSKKFIEPDFISTYAQVHPEDNFCEVFAVYVSFCGNMREIRKFLKQKKKSDKVLKQFIWLDRFIKKNYR